MENLAVLNDVMTNYFVKEIPQMFSNDLFGYEMLGTRKETMKGKKIQIGMQLAENERGIGGRGEEGALPTADHNEFDASYANVTYQYGVVSVTNQSIKETNDEHTLVKNLKRITDGTMNAFKNNWNRMFFSDGGAQLGVVASLSGTTFAVASDKIYNFRKRMFLDIYNGTTKITPPSASEGFHITDIDYVNLTITLNTATGVANGHLLYREGNTYVDTTIKNYEIDGLGYFMSNSNTMQEIDRTANSWWQAYMKDAGSTDVTEALLMQWLDQQNAITGDDSMVDVILMNQGMKRAIVSMLRAENVPTDGKPTQAGFGKGFTYDYGGNEIVMKEAKMSSANSLLGFNTNNLWIAETAPLEWRNGGALTEREGYDTAWTDFSWYCNLVTDRGNAFTQFYGLNEK